MEVVSGDNWTTGAIGRAKLQSNHHHQQTNIQFFTGRIPFQSPNQQCQSTEGKNITFHGLAYLKLTWGLPTLSLTTNSSWLPRCWHWRISSSFVVPRGFLPCRFLAISCNELFYSGFLQTFQHCFPGFSTSQSTKFHALLGLSKYNICTYKHTHTLCFNGHFYRWTLVSRLPR